MTDRTLGFYFDYLSPYSYLAWQEVPAMARRLELLLEPRPVLLAVLLSHHGHKGAGEIPPKHEYVIKDLIRRAAAADIPVAPPFSHPFNPLLCARVTTLEMKDEQRIELVSRLFASTWAEGLDVSSPDVVARICDKVGVPNAIERVQDAAVKTRLKESIADAIQRGVFGLPTMEVSGELFWGADSFEHLERYLEGEDPVERDTLEAWRAIQASAVRKTAG